MKNGRIGFPRTRASKPVLWWKSSLFPTIFVTRDMQFFFEHGNPYLSRMKPLCWIRLLHIASTEFEGIWWYYCKYMSYKVRILLTSRLYLCARWGSMYDFEDPHFSPNNSGKTFHPSELKLYKLTNTNISCSQTHVCKWTSIFTIFKFDDKRWAKKPVYVSERSLHIACEQK